MKPRRSPRPTCPAPTSGGGLRPHNSRVGALVLAGVVLILSACVGPDPGLSEATPTPVEAPSPLLLPTPPDVDALAAPDCSNGRIVTVDYVVDGDTLALFNAQEERVRLVGIDTPESYPADSAECYSQEAKEYATAQVERRVICLTYDPAVTQDSGNVDVYGRTLGYVFFGTDFSRFLNAELVQGGYANDYPYTAGAVFEDYFLELERYAQLSGNGLWTSCP